MEVEAQLKSAIDRFCTIAAELNRFMSESEKVFLATGSRLQHLEEEAGRVLTESSTGTQMASGNLNPAEDLRQGLLELDRHLDRGKAETENGVGALSSVMTEIRKISGFDGQFHTIVTTLHALASTTRLENSTRVLSQLGFDSVVSDLRSMAVRIRPKFGDVLSKGHEVRTTAEAALLKAHGFLDRHRRDVARLRRQTTDQLTAMASTYQTSYALANRATDSVASVRKNIGRILQSLQVQDIVRQIVEHVVQDLEEFARSARDAIASGTSDAHLRPWIAELAIVSDVEAAQLNHARERLAGSLSQIDAALRSITAALTVLAADASAFAGEGGSSTLAQLEKSIRSSVQALDDHNLQRDSMVKALAKVRDTAVGIEELVDEVGRLGQDARFIGLNAMVKAIRIGQAGATLTVLAREIQTISEEIQTFTSSLAAIMQSVGQGARQLAGASGAEVCETGQRGDGVATGLQALLGELGTYQSSLHGAVALLNSGGAVLRAEVEPISQELRGLSVQSRGLLRISRELASLHRQAAQDAQGVEPPPGRAHRESRRHTMEEERRVQRVVVEGRAGTSREENPRPADSHSAEGSVEFF